MTIIYDSDNYYVLEYLFGQGYEVVDKHAGRATFLAGDVANSFLASMFGAINEDPSVEHVDDFLSGFGVLSNYSTTLH